MLEGGLAEQFVIMLRPRGVAHLVRVRARFKISGQRLELGLGLGLACGVAHVGRGEDVHVDDQVRIQLLEGHLVRRSGSGLGLG